MPTDTLHVVTGGGATGKSSVRRALRGEVDAALFEYDSLLGPIGGPPEGTDEEGADRAREINETWLTICGQAASSGCPVVLFGVGLLPRLVEPCDARDRFEEVRYLALVCEDAVQRRRLSERDGWTEREDYWSTDERQMELNEWFREEGRDPESPILTHDTTDESQEETTAAVRAWLE